MLAIIYYHVVNNYVIILVTRFTLYSDIKPTNYFICLICFLQIRYSLCINKNIKTQIPFTYAVLCRNRHNMIQYVKYRGHCTS